MGFDQLMRRTEHLGNMYFYLLFYCIINQT